MDKYSKLPLFFGDRQFVDDKEEVEGNEGAIENVCENLANDDVAVEGFGEEHQYPRGSGNHLENNGRITFCLNVVRNGPMWQYLKLIRVGV